MLRKLLFLLPVCASVLPGCMSTPQLSEATGEEHSEIMIKDVVQRVKCELSEAFDKKVEERDFLWLASWTAHMDLTLEVNENSGLSPSGTYTKYLGSTATSSAVKPLASIASTFSLGAGASLNGQAVRTEALSFTVALDELKRWRRDLEKKEAPLPPEKRTCNFDPSMGVTGNLGLKEWVDSAFFPVETGQLKAGVHPSQGSLKGGAKGPSQGGGKKAKAMEFVTKAQIEEDTKKWQIYLLKLQTDLTPLTTKISDATTKLDSADTTLQAKLQNLANSKFENVLDPHLKRDFARYANFKDVLASHKQSEENCPKYKDDVDAALKEAGDIETKLRAGATAEDLSVLYADLTQKAGNIEHNDKAPSDPDGKPAGEYVKSAKQCAADLTALAGRTTIAADTLPAQIDPPIDAVSHSLQFVVAYGVNISPSWLLLQWKGPGQSGNLFSATNTRTHSLSIAIGPRETNSAATTGTAASPDALRLINNNVIRSLRN